MGGHPAGRSDTWFTPGWLVDRVRDDIFDGEIHSDPATTLSNPVRAQHFYTKREDGLIWPWLGHVFLNPPHSKAAAFCDKAISEAKAGSRVVVLVPARPDSKYMQRLLEAAVDFILVRGRLTFTRPNGKEGAGAAFGSLLVGLNVSVAPLADIGILVTIKKKR